MEPFGFLGTTLSVVVDLRVTHNAKLQGTKCVIMIGFIIT